MTQKVMRTDSGAEWVFRLGFLSSRGTHFGCQLLLKLKSPLCDDEGQLFNGQVKNAIDYSTFKKIQKVLKRFQNAVSYGLLCTHFIHVECEDGWL